MMNLQEVYLRKLLHQAWNRDLSFPYRKPLKLRVPPYEGQSEAPSVCWLQALESEQYCKGIPSHVRTNEWGKHPIFLGQEAFWGVIFQNVSSLHHDNQVCRQNGMDSVLCGHTLKKKTRIFVMNLNTWVKAMNMNTSQTGHAWLLLYFVYAKKYPFLELIN